MPTTVAGAPGQVPRVENTVDVAALARLAEHADSLARSTRLLEQLAAQLPAALATFTDTADDMVRSAGERGIDVDERLRSTAALLERLTAPATVALLRQLLDRANQLQRLLALADQLPGFFALAVDAADDVVARAAADGLDIERGMLNGAHAAIRFGAIMGPAEVDSLEALLHSGVLDPAAVRVIGGIGRSLATSARAEHPRVGPLAALRALRDPDIQRALGFLLGVAKQFGDGMSNGHEVAVRA